ncbi:MAG: TlpA disulfide reductase family protein [Bacteroidota bacterium]
MDSIEDFFEQNKDQFNYLKADPESWDHLKGQLEQDQVPRPAIRIQLWRNVAAFLVLGLLLGNLLLSEHKYPATVDIGLQEDMQFPDLELRNPDGEMVALSSLKGKVVLVEFWASYCMLCTEEHCYYFKPLYNAFKDQGFEIYSVSIDSSAHNWLKVIERDQLDWVQVSDLMGNDSPINEKFEVNSLPTNYLLDQDGKILARNIPVEELEDTLSMLLALQ